MSRHASRALVPLQGSIAGILTILGPLASAQTIGDYSRAQRAWLESTMSQAAARSAGLVAPAPAATVPVSLPASAPVPRATMPAPAPVVQVSGVFASGQGAVAQVVVNASAYLLSVGQRVPGTAWQVETIAVDKVVLERPASASVSNPEGARKVFSLPALY
jgi:type IV pilus biogenesis protein PilP